MSQSIKSFKKDKLQVNVYPQEKDAAAAANGFVVKHLHTAIQEKGEANLILGTGTSQFAFLDALKQKDLDWKKITVFHLDEYIGFSDQHPASFRKYLKERILDIVNPGKVYLIKGDAPDLQNEMGRYENLLKNHPVDVVCIGIGENGHIAFNDPPVADFNDSKWVRIVELDDACRRQQFGEGWFQTLDDVPKVAITLTIPAIMSAKAISCLVPGLRKAQAVENALTGDISTACPASILRKHPHAILFMDESAASKIGDLLLMSR